MNRAERMLYVANCVERLLMMYEMTHGVNGHRQAALEIAEVVCDSSIPASLHDALIEKVQWAERLRALMPPPEDEEV